MNYSHYEDKIVESLKVALVGWPLSRCIRQPGHLSTNELNTLQEALRSGECKWIKLTSVEVLARKRDNQQRMENGEQVYGPPRKKRRIVGGGHDGDDV